MNYQDIDISNLDFASLSLNESSCAQSNGMFKGWGTEESRKAYTSLQQLAASQNLANQIDSQAMQCSLTPSSCDSSIAGDNNGFFICDDDNMNCDENFW
jgi:hypothetical protein